MDKLKKRVLLITVGGLVVAVAGSLTVSAVAGQEPLVSSADISSAESALLASWDTSQKAPVSPALSQTPTVAEMSARSAVSDAPQRKAAALTKLSKLFTGKALDDQKAVVDRGIDSTADPTFKVLGGGADSLDVTNVNAVDANTVHVTGTLRTWSKMAFLQDGKVIMANPSNLLDVDETLARQSDGSWAVSDFTWNFHPGSEP